MLVLAMSAIDKGEGENVGRKRGGRRKGATCGALG